MHNTPLSDPPLDLPAHEYYHLVHTLTGYLPPPLADTPQARCARNQAALAQVAAMLPTNANELGFAVQCIAARAHADDVLRQIREHACGDIRFVIKLNAQYSAMVRASLGAHGHLLRAQAVRHKREANADALKADEWTQHIVARALQQALDAGPPLRMPAAAAAVPPAEPPAPPPPAAEPPVPVAPPPAAVLTAALPRAPAAAPTLPPVSLAAGPPPAAAEPPVPVAPPPAAVLTAALPRAPAAAPTLPLPLASLAAGLPPEPAAPAPTPPPPPPRRMATRVEPDELPRDLDSEADCYAVVYPRRAREIRHYGGLPPDCSFGPPDDALLHAIVTGTTPALCALDASNAATAD